MALKEKLDFEVKKIKITGLLDEAYVKKDEKSGEYIQKFIAIFDNKCEKIVINIKFRDWINDFTCKVLSLLNAEDIFLDAYTNVDSRGTIHDDASMYILKYSHYVNGVFANGKLIGLANLDNTKWIMLFGHFIDFATDFENLKSKYIEELKTSLNKNITQIRSSVEELLKYTDEKNTLYLKEALTKLDLVDLNEL